MDTVEPFARQGERGAALVTALCMMLVVLMLGVSAARAALSAGRSARIERDRHVAMAAAEAALTDAERDIEGAAGASSPRTALFNSGAALADGCGRGADDLGLCRAARPPFAPVWQQVDLAGNAGVTVAYGSFTGAEMATGSASLPARLPRYIIERLPQEGAAAAAGALYRITAIGFGAVTTTRVVLQSFYRKRSAPGQGSGSENGDDNENENKREPPAASLPAGRTSWREVANWTELHEAAIE